MEEQSNLFKFLLVLFFIALTLVGIGVATHFHGFVNEDNKLPSKRNSNSENLPNPNQ